MYSRTAIIKHAKMAHEHVACLVSELYGSIFLLKLGIAPALLLLLLFYQPLGVRPFAEVFETIFLQCCAISVGLHQLVAEQYPEPLWVLQHRTVAATVLCCSHGRLILAKCSMEDIQRKMHAIIKERTVTPAGSWSQRQRQNGR